MSNVIVIGGGASGLVAAIHSAKNGANVTILEKNKVCGKKILLTGNGRCNYWNSEQNISHYRSNNIDIAEKILSEEMQEEALAFFKSIGIEPKIKDGYYYPSSNQAVSIQTALLLEAQLQNVSIQTETTVEKIEKVGARFKVVTTNGVVEADKVIVSTGSKAAAKTGSDGSGYEILESLGHTVIKPLPALVQLKGDEKYFKDWAGVRVDANVSLYESGQKIAEEFGELQLTDYGISGICVFQISGRVARGLDNGKKEQVIINFLPQLDKEFIEYMDERSGVVKERTISQLLDGMLNYKLVNVLLKKSKVEGNKKWKQLSVQEKAELSKNVTRLEISIVGTNSFDKAQVCSGGVPLNEIEPTTLESKKVSGLYITGELLDVDGDCGGYNLEWAWITGIIAGRASGK